MAEKECLVILANDRFKGRESVGANDKGEIVLTNYVDENTAELFRRVNNRAGFLGSYIRISDDINEIRFIPSGIQVLSSDEARLLDYACGVSSPKDAHLRALEVLEDVMIHGDESILAHDHKVFEEIASKLDGVSFDERMHRWVIEESAVEIDDRPGFDLGSMAMPDVSLEIDR